MTIRPIRRVLIANRGEIAVRVMRTCHRLSIDTVAVYSDSDADALFVKMAGRAVHIGPSPSNESYLCIDKIIHAALATGADAIHPGYGFLSENADFARECKKHGIIFIGPQPESILSIGDKIEAKRVLSSKAPSVPLIPGYNGEDQSPERLVKEALKIGFPVLLKCSAGGGGKGMRIVREESRLKEEIEMAKGEGKRSFGNDNLLIEKYFEHVKHVEVQIMGDKHGNVYHCFERECSVQRRHQKVIEETPSPALDSGLRARMTEAAVTIGKLIRYEGAGTVEFIVDANTKQFYFLEVNTRLQVEHPITEAITGLDLVELQIRVASGESLSAYGLDQLRINGHAIESRLYAEDPNNNFFPCTGRIILWNQRVEPGNKYPRYDTGVSSGSVISVFYDPLISKVTVWAPNRREAILCMEQALRETVCLGLVTNKSFLLQVLKHEEFIRGSYVTRLVDQMQTQGITLGFNIADLKSRQTCPIENVDPASNRSLEVLSRAPHQLVKAENGASSIFNLGQEVSVVAMLWNFYRRRALQKHWKLVPSGWRVVRWRPDRETFKIDLDKDTEISLEYLCRTETYQSNTNGQWSFFCRFVTIKNMGSKNSRVDVVDKVGPWFSVQLLSVTPLNKNYTSGRIICVISNQRKRFSVAQATNCTPEESFDTFVHSVDWERQFCVTRMDPRRTSVNADDDPVSSYTSSMPCRVLKLLVENKSKVKPGQPLLTMESMKMETRLYSKHEGEVQFFVKEGQVVEAGTQLLKVN